MNTNKRRKFSMKISRKTVLFTLIMLSFIMSSSTFAYWASYVEGAFNSHQFDFTVGSKTYQDYDFILFDEGEDGDLIIDTDILVDNKKVTGESIDVIFGALWEELDDEEKERIAYIEFDYEIYGEKNGKEWNKNKYKKMEKILEISFDDDNEDFLSMNTTKSFGMTVGVDQDAKNRDLDYLEKSDVVVIVTYNIIYEEDIE